MLPLVVASEEVIDGGVGFVVVGVVGVVEAEMGVLLGVVLKDRRGLDSVTVSELDQADRTWQDLGQGGRAQ